MTDDDGRTYTQGYAEGAAAMQHYADAYAKARVQLRPAVARIRHQRDELARLLAREAALVQICAETYQVVGVLASDCGRFNGDDVERVLDNLSQQKLVHSDVLPFESAARPTRTRTSVTASLDTMTGPERKAYLDQFDDGHGPYMEGCNMLDGRLTVHPLWDNFKAWAADYLGQGFSLAAVEGNLVDEVTSYCFEGFRAGWAAALAAED